MFNEGVVLEINKKGAVVMSPDKGIVVIKSRKDMTLGQLVYFNDSDVIDLHKRRLFRAIVFGASAAAAFIFIFFMVFQFNTQDKVYSYVDIEINPGIEFALDKENKVLNVTKLNSDAEALLKGIDLKETNLKEAITEVLEKSSDEGYFNENQASVLFSASLSDRNIKQLGGSELKKLDEILNLCKEAASNLNNIRAEIRTLKTTAQLKVLAEQANTSMARYALYERLKAANQEKPLSEIKKMTVKDLFKFIEVEDIYQGSVTSPTKPVSNLQPTSAKSTNPLNGTIASTSSVPTPAPSTSGMSGSTSAGLLPIHTSKSQTPLPTSGTAGDNQAVGIFNVTPIFTSSTSMIGKSATPLPADPTPNSFRLNSPTPSPSKNNSSNNDKNVVSDSFNNGNTHNWALDCQENAAATAEVVNGELKIHSKSQGKSAWDINFHQAIPALKVGTQYKIEFKIRSSKAAKYYAKIGDAAEPFGIQWQTGWTPVELAAGTDTVISQKFITRQQTSEQEIAFHFGGELAGQLPNDIFLDDIVLTELP